MDAAMHVFQITKTFPAEERYSLVDQMRRSSRSVCANLGEAWRKRRYRAAFLAKLNDCEGEATETSIWITFALRCGYINSTIADQLQEEYDHICAQLVRMSGEPEKWLLPPAPPRLRAAPPAEPPTSPKSE